MPDIFQAIDERVFFFLNGRLTNAVLDVVMPFITNVHNWQVPILLVWLALLIWGGRKGRTAALLLILVLTAADQMSSGVLKPLFGRIRPCNALEGVRLLVSSTSSFSFPSGHATNIFAVALLFSRFYPHLRTAFFGMAVAVAYSRVYVGVHYPSDVIAGALLGMAIAWAILAGYRVVAARVGSRGASSSPIG